MPRCAPNKIPSEVKRGYFQPVRSGLSGSEASQPGGRVAELRVAVVHRRWAGGFIDASASPRFLSQRDFICLHS
jgi:transposase, IS30 family